MIDADQAGNEDYTAAPTASQSVTVQQGPVFTSASPPPTATAGTPYAAHFTASGSPAPTYQLVAGAPSFLTVDTTTGVVSGTPTGPGRFGYAVSATNPVGTVTTATYTVTVAAAAWQASVRGFTAPAPGSAKGVYLGVAGDRWTLDVTQPTKTKTTYTGTVTLDHGTFSRLAGIKLEAGDTVKINGNTLTFNLTSYGDLDGLTFITPAAANTIYFILKIAGAPATSSQIFTGNPRTASPTSSPVTYRRTPGQ